jgi:hypothetical protein
LDVSVERQLTSIGDVPLDTGDDVVAVRIADGERGARLRAYVGRTGEDDKNWNERNRQPADSLAVGEGRYGCRTASPNAVTTSFAVKLQWPAGAVKRFISSSL